MNQICLTPETAFPAGPHHIPGKQAAQPQCCHPIVHASLGFLSLFPHSEAPHQQESRRIIISQFPSKAVLVYTMLLALKVCHVLSH